MKMSLAPARNQPMASVPIKQEDFDDDDGGASPAASMADADPNLVPLLPGEAWGYPAGCQVAFHFRPAPLGRGDTDFEAGVIRSLHMNRSTREILFAVEPLGREGESVIVPERDIGYAAGFPITVTMAGQFDADGEVMFAMPKFDGNGEVEFISYAVVIMLDGNKCRIMSNVPRNQIKYREVAEEGLVVTSNVKESEDTSFGKPSEETLSGQQPSSKSAIWPSQGVASSLSAAEHVKTKKRESGGKSDRNRKQPVARSKRKQTKPDISSARGASANKRKRDGSITDSAENESNSSQGAASLLSAPEHARTKRREFEGKSNRNRKQAAARSHREQTKPTMPSAHGASTKKRKRDESITDSAEDESDSDGYSPLRVGSRVNVLYRGTEWRATILEDKVKNGELGVLVHYEGSKAKSRDWVSIDKVVSLAV